MALKFAELDKFKEILPKGISLEKMKMSDVDNFIELLTSWYPQFTVGAEKRFANAAFYKNEIFQNSEKVSLENKFLPILYKDIENGAIAGCMFVEKDDAAITVSSPMAAIATEYRGKIKGLASLGPRLLLEIGKQIKADLVYYFSTLISISNQKIAEKVGYKLVGIVPAFDRDLISPGNIKRSPEGIYAVVLAPSENIQNPTAEGMTEETTRLWNFLFENEKT